MLIYNSNSVLNILNRKFKNRRKKNVVKNRKIEYKSVDDRIPEFIRTKAVKQECQRKKLSKKNVQFLKELGLEVKQ